MPSISTLPGIADIDGPRTVRHKPATWLYASVNTLYARTSGTSK
ncbi:MAG: hypothetical protein CM1200mP29_05740 [Verrucomicrobiota bacterium]|nr:MAG: hypothetical protein CM1200mP29_05740 [Verrucomicrobiota bacterium]